jgi:hypothetical protein
MRHFTIVTLAAVLAGCSASAVEPVRSEKAQTRLAEALAGKAAGKPVSCLPPGKSWHTNVIDDNTILFENGSTVYRQDPAGGCSPIGSGSYALLTKTSLSSICQGDIARVIDTTTGITVGSCGLTEFVPYR